MKSTITIIKKLTLFTVLIASLGACSSSGNTRPAQDKDSAANYNARLGAEYTRKGRLNLANEKLQKALEQDPNSAEAHHYYAILQQRLGQDNQADVHFRRAMQLSPKDPQLLNNYGSHLCKVGRYQEASKQFLAAINDPLYTTPEFAYTNAGICIRGSGDTNQAEIYFRKALELKPTFGSALYQMAKLKYQQGDYARAKAFLQRYHQQNREEAETLSLCAKINTKLGDQNGAEECRNKLAGAISSSREFAEFGG